jgi:hypothetical protein
VRKTIYLPADLAAQIEDYLRLHKGETLSSLAQRAIQREVGPKDRSAMLKLIGLVPADAPRHVVPIEELQPEDQVIFDER